MYPAIRSYDVQAFDNTSEERGKTKTNKKKNFVYKSLQYVPSQGMFEQAKKNMAASGPSNITQDML